MSIRELTLCHLMWYSAFSDMVSLFVSERSLFFALNDI